jgi:glyoxylase-like metal-dependent hydrolase (beta-lactamase superfamily II)
VAVRNGRFCAHIYVDRLLSSYHAELPKSQVPRGAVRASFGLYNDASDVEQFLSYVERVKNRKWVGRYQQKGSEMNAEFAGRCADTWMEVSADSESGHEHGPSLGYEFVPLHSDDVNRAYLIIDEDSREAAIVDPVRERVDEYLDVLLARGAKLKYTIETHTHADHIAASARLKDLTGCKMLMHKAAPAPCVDQHLDDGDTIQVGSVKIQVMATPGHTQDCMCLLLPDRVLTGDTLLIGSCGRTDLPTGDASALWKSLQRLKALPEDTMVFPGHDYKGQRASTIGRERKSNPRLGIENAEAFAESMGRLSIPPPVKLEESLNANQKCL